MGRLFLDSNVLIKGFVQPWNFDRGARSLIRHAADVPVLVSAIQAAPDWLITNNTEHFTPEVAAKTSLRIATPQQFVRAIQ
jgi:hypothetical protein